MLPLYLCAGTAIATPEPGTTSAESQHSSTLDAIDIIKQGITQFSSSRQSSDDGFSDQNVPQDKV
jgi:hypothetical protein